MKNKVPFYQSLIAKAVLWLTALFAVFYIVERKTIAASFTTQMVFLALFGLIVAVILFGLWMVTTNLNAIQGQIEDIKNDKYDSLRHLRGNNETNLIYHNLVSLGEEIKHTKGNLESQKNSLNSILTYMTDGVIATDRRGKIILANEASYRHLNLHESQMINQKIIDVLNINAEYSFRELLEQEPELTLDVENSEGDFTTLRVNFDIFRRESGFISGLVAVLHDVTEQEKMENERKLFVSNVSHELRTPLTSVKSYLESLHDGALNDPEVAPRFVKISLDETNRMMRMISDLLTISRLDSQTELVTREITNLVAFLHYQLTRFDKIIHSEYDDRYKLTRQLPIKAAWVELDTDKFTQVIDNILNNAIKYSPDGGEINVDLTISNTQAIIKISDQGMGIPKRDLNKVFDRFYRVDKARSRAQGGSGLGLAIVKDIVRLHDGFVWANSDGKSGTTITIILPLTSIDTDDDVDAWDGE